MTVEHSLRCFICATCGTQYAESSKPPELCTICSDDRQYVGWHGQEWTTLEELRAKHSVRIDEDHGLTGIEVSDGFAISQRALLVPSAVGNVLWETISLVTNEAVSSVRDRGGVAVIVISHPHFYSSMVEWSEALGGVPILLHDADKRWVFRKSPLMEFWRGDTLRIAQDACLLRLGGHFPGSTALHWLGPNRHRGTLFPGDAMQVASDRRHVSFMYSYPNYLPMRREDVRWMRLLLRDLHYEDIYGFSWGRNIIGGAKAAVAASMERYLSRVA